MRDAEYVQGQMEKQQDLGRGRDPNAPGGAEPLGWLWRVEAGQAEPGNNTEGVKARGSEASREDPGPGFRGCRAHEGRRVGSACQRDWKGRE